MQKHKGLTIEVHPILYAYLTKGFPSKRMKWRIKFKERIKIQPNTNYHLTEFHFFDKSNEEIKLQL
jgi:ribonuclease G